MIKLQDFIYPAWAVFWIYWFVTAATAKRSVGRHNAFTYYRIILLLVFVALANLPSHSGLRNQALVVHSLTLKIIGTLIFIAGLLFAVWARATMGNNWGMPMTTKEQPELVTTGPYRFVRHPIYTGIITASIGTTLAAGWGWLVFTILIGGYFIYSAFNEEDYLAKEFPDSYPKYKSRTKMLLPFLF